MLPEKILGKREVTSLDENRDPLSRGKFVKRSGEPKTTRTKGSIRTPHPSFMTCQLVLRPCLSRSCVLPKMGSGVEVEEGRKKGKGVTIVLQFFRIMRIQSLC